MIARGFILVVLLLCGACFAMAAEPATTNSKPEKKVEYQNSVWLVSLWGERYMLKAGDGNEMTGNAGVVSIGRGYLGPAWYILGAVDLVMGPYEPVRNRQLDVDYFGTGASLWAGVSAQNSDLRTPDGGYGFAIGLSYLDSIGRSVGKNRIETSDISVDRENDLIDNYILRTSQFAVIPAVFFSWLKEARPVGNKPELLMTRTEGFFVTLGVAAPLLTTYSATYNKRFKYGGAASKNIPDGEDANARGSEVSEHGRLNGLSVLVGVTAFLGG